MGAVYAFYKDGRIAQMNNGTPQSLHIAPMLSVALLYQAQVAALPLIMQLMFILLKLDSGVQISVSQIQLIWLLQLVQIYKMYVEQKHIHF